jgi:hypothetical protein
MARNEALSSILSQLEVLEIPVQIRELIHEWVNGAITREELAPRIVTALEEEVNNEPGLDTPEIRERCFEVAKSTIIQQLDLIDAAMVLPLNTEITLQKEKDIRRSSRIKSATPLEHQTETMPKRTEKSNKRSGKNILLEQPGNVKDIASTAGNIKDMSRTSKAPEVIVPKPLKKRIRTSPSLSPSRSISPYGWEPKPLSSSQPQQQARLSPLEEEDENMDEDGAIQKLVRKSKEDARTMKKMLDEMKYLRSHIDNKDEENQRLIQALKVAANRNQNEAANAYAVKNNTITPQDTMSTEQLPYMTYDRAPQGSATDINKSTAQWVWGDPRYPQPTQNGLFRNFKTTLYMFTFGDQADKEMMLKWDKETTVIQYQELMLVMNVARFKTIFGKLRFEHNDGTWADVVRILTSFWPFEHLGKNLPGPDLLFMTDVDILKKYNNGGAICSYESWAKAWAFYKGTFCAMLPYMKPWLDEHEKILSTHWTTCSRIYKNEPAEAFASFYCFEKWYRYLVAQNRGSLFGSKTLLTEALESHNPLKPAHDELPFKGKDNKVYYAHYITRPGQVGRGRGTSAGRAPFIPRGQPFAPRGLGVRGRGQYAARGIPNAMGRDQVRAELASQICENYPQCNRGEVCLKQHRCPICNLARNDLRRFGVQQCMCAT